MTAKQYLSQARLLDARIASKWECIRRLESCAERCTTTISGTPRGGSGADWTSLVIKIDMERERLNADIDRLVNLKAELERAIHAVDDTRAELVLELRYLAFWDWQKIADVMCYGKTAIWMIHGEALKKIVVPESANTIEL